MLGGSGRCTTWWRPLVATPRVDRRGESTSVDVVKELAGIDRHRLERLVRTSLGRDTAELIDWRRPPIHTGADLASSMSRVAGTARERRRVALWSVVFKIDLEQAALATYTEDLRNAGRRGDPRQVRLDYTIAPGPARWAGLCASRAPDGVARGHRGVGACRIRHSASRWTRPWTAALQ